MLSFFAPSFRALCLLAGLLFVSSHCCMTAVGQQTIPDARTSQNQKTTSAKTSSSAEEAAKKKADLVLLLKDTSEQSSFFLNVLKPSATQEYGLQLVNKDNEQFDCTANSITTNGKALIYISSSDNPRMVLRGTFNALCQGKMSLPKYALPGAFIVLSTGSCRTADGSLPDVLLVEPCQPRLLFVKVNPLVVDQSGGNPTLPVATQSVFVLAFVWNTAGSGAPTQI